MYKILIADSNSQLEGFMNDINKQHGKIVFVNNDKYAMYIIYEVSEHGSEI